MKITLSFLFPIFLFILALTVPFFVSAMTITLSVPEKYSEVKAGEKIYFETEVKWPENIGRKDLRIEYFVKDEEGVDVAYLKVLKAIETQASFMDNIAIPLSVTSGMYKIIARISDYGNLDQEVGASFNVKKNRDTILSYLIIILGGLGIIVIFVVIEMFFLLKENKEHHHSVS